MPIGSPDFNANLSTNPTSPSYDTGEDTTRLLMGGGSQARSGRWLWATGFEEGETPYLNTSVNGTPGLGYAGIYKVSTYQGVGSLQLRPQAVVGNYAQFVKGFNFPTSNYGIEFMFWVQGDPTIEIFIDAYGLGENDTIRRVAKVVFEKVSGTWGLYIDRNGTKELVSTLYTVPSSSSSFRYFKMVFDPSTNKIKRINYANVSYEVNADAYEATTAASIESFNFWVKVTNTLLGNNQYILIDNLIITADEP